MSLQIVAFATIVIHMAAIVKSFPEKSSAAKRLFCGRLRLSKNPLPNETDPGSNLVASQSFPARRRENKIIILKISGHAPGILNHNRASVRLRRARSPMQVLIVSSLLDTKICLKSSILTGLNCARMRYLPCWAPAQLRHLPFLAQFILGNLLKISNRF